MPLYHPVDKGVAGADSRWLRHGPKLEEAEIGRLDDE
jgi:hypothetical protein